MYYRFLGTVATLGSFLFSFFLNLASSALTSASCDDCIETQRQQRQGRCRCASGRTSRRERAAEGATRVVGVGARRGLRQHCWQQVDNVTRGSNEQRTAGGCSNDGGGNVVTRTAGGGRCNKARRIRRTMQQHQTETADNGTRSGGVVFR